MNKLLKTIIIAVVGLGAIAFAASYFIKKETKKNSPQDTVEYTKDDLTIRMVYCQPYKKGRVIFGSASDKALQPYGQYWRLGANEATTIEFNQDLSFGGKKIIKGVYSIYAVPAKDTWKFGFNKDSNRWGASEPDYDKDVLIIDAPINYSNETLEQFTISINNSEIIFKWDTSVVKLPYTK